MAPVLILIIGITLVITLIVAVRLHAFLALITAALVVSLLAPGAPAEKISRVAIAFGSTAGKIGIIIAMAAIIGRCLIESGAADRIVRMFIRLFGENRCPVALMSSGFILSIPVFFDTVFYLLLPLARSMHRRTGKNYVMLILAMGAGASITHSLVPPTPGPLIIAGTLGVDLGVMILIGLLVAACTAVVILPFISWLSGRMHIPMRTPDGMRKEIVLNEERLPGLFSSLLPIGVPILLISADTFISMWAKSAPLDSILNSLTIVTAVAGNANFAMVTAAGIALLVLRNQRRLTRKELAKTVEGSLLSAGIIILITSAGGAFGAMLQAADAGGAIQTLVRSGSGRMIGGMQLLFVGFLIAFILKFAQGSSTISMITTSAIVAAFINADSPAYHPVYIACAIGFGAQCGNWMNDSGFWIFAKMSGLTEVETLKTWTVTVSALAVIGFLFTLIFATVLPLAP